ncbi:MAG: HAD family hydrolase [Desertifilum sp. SIO1I2]|nr:HAD family hydrolase [Desertifilum sp. SIO1I2]
MSSETPGILALDFDGVLCDGLQEYFQTTWRTYRQLWMPSKSEPPEDLAPVFYRLRPVIETGWEMPILLRAIFLGYPEEDILQDWPNVVQHILEAEDLKPKTLEVTLDTQRDAWIASDEMDWLSYHRFFPGVLDKVRSLLSTPIQLFIITTKEERFVRTLLQQQDINLPQQQIYGKSTYRPKHEILRDLSTTGEKLWFVEDRLKTLQSVQKQADLWDVVLFLADWGYNTQTERDSVGDSPRIHLLSLEQFSQDFAQWRPVAKPI